MWSVAAPRSAQARRDPAPTRWSYRYQRMMLTPVLRRLITRILPVCAVGAVIVGIAMLPANRARMAQAWTDARAQLESRPEFELSAMAIHGADDDLQRAIRAALPYDFPMSRFDLDLDETRATVAALPAVENASLVIRSGGILELRVAQRIPVAMWRSREGLKLVDANGITSGYLSQRGDRPDLPIIGGEGANTEIAEAQALMAALGPVAPRLRGVLRRGERRWDVILDRDQRIMLPEQGAVQALERVVALAQATDILDRDIVAVDMRVPHRPLLRLTSRAATTLRETRLAVTE